MGLAEFKTYCQRRQLGHTKDGDLKRGRFIGDILRDPRIIGIEDFVEQYAHVALIEEGVRVDEKGRRGGRAEAGVMDVVLITNNGVYVCMAKVCNRSGRRVSRRLGYAEDYIERHFGKSLGADLRLVSARRHKGKTYFQTFSLV